MSYQQLRVPILFSILAALLTLAIKFTAYYWTGSVSLFSDAVESLANLAASTTALACLWYAAQPADVTHTYGHEKIEYFSSGLEGMLILTAAGGIAWYAVKRLLFQEPLHELGLGTLLSTGAAVINFFVAQALLRVGKRYGSIVLEADGHHLMTDVWTSAGVLVGLFLVWLTGWEILDPILALLMAANIVWTALDLLKRSFNGLMDHSLPSAEQEQLRQAIMIHLPPGFHFHAVRTRRAGTRRFADFHLLVPGAWSVQKAHDLTEQIEHAVRSSIPGIEVTVHIEPLEDQASWQDSALLAVEEKR